MTKGKQTWKVTQLDLSFIVCTSNHHFSVLQEGFESEDQPLC